MSWFDEFGAHEIAKAAVRGDVRPLIGHEAALLSALREAETLHDQSLAREEAMYWESEAAKDDFVEARDKPLARFAKAVTSALTEWRGMTDEQRRLLARFAVDTDPPHPFRDLAGEWDGKADWLAPITDQIEQALAAIADLNARLLPEGGAVAFPPGRDERLFQTTSGLFTEDATVPGVKRKGGKAQLPVFVQPLSLFAQSLKEFWTATTGLPFSVEFGAVEATPAQVKAGQKPEAEWEAKSPAARFLWSAASRFKWPAPDDRPLYLIQNVETVARKMRDG